MTKELNKTLCLNKINKVSYTSSPSLLTSGRYVKSLHHLLANLKSEDEKIECQYLINKCLGAHIVYLQEAIINSFNTQFTLSTISKQQGDFFKDLAKSDFSVKEGKYSLMHAEGLKNLMMLEKTVLLSKSSLVLPCKIKSLNGKYHFNTQIIMTDNNVLAYASSNFDKNESNKNVNHNTLITKMGKGFKNALNKEKNTTRQGGML